MGGHCGTFRAVLGGAVRCWGCYFEYPTTPSLPLLGYDLSPAVNLNGTQRDRSSWYANSPAFGFWQQAPDHAPPVRRRERCPGAGLFKGDAEGHTRGEASGHRLAGDAPRQEATRPSPTPRPYFQCPFPSRKGPWPRGSRRNERTHNVTLGRGRCLGCRASSPRPLFLPCDTVRVAGPSSPPP